MGGGARWAQVAGRTAQAQRTGVGKGHARTGAVLLGMGGRRTKHQEGRDVFIGRPPKSYGRWTQILQHADHCKEGRKDRMVCLKRMPTQELY